MIKYIDGYTIISDRYCPDQTRRPRSWNERLFSWPWRPFKTHADPETVAYFLENEKIIIVSPNTYASLKLKQIEKV